MKSPFPGMDPYLEARWSDVHAKLIGFIGEALQPNLPKALRARAEQRVLLEETEEEPPIAPEVKPANAPAGARLSQFSLLNSHFPSVAVCNVGVDPLVIRHYDGPTVEKFIHIIDVTSGNRVVTAIEILSPWNKSPGRLNREYLRKLDDYARGEVSVVEIDLLRYPPRGRLGVSEADIPLARRAPYMVWVRRGWTPEESPAYPVSLRHPLPQIPIPLRRTDAEIGLDLQPLIDRVYISGGHDDIDYRRAADPPLDPPDAAWADELLQAAGKR